MKKTILFALVLACLRIYMGFTMEPEPATLAQVYKDTAHLFMGGLFVAAWLQKHKWQWATFWTLNVVEVAVAILSRVV